MTGLLYTNLWLDASHVIINNGSGETYSRKYLWSHLRREKYETYLESMFY
jgi:hypothetical protein